MHKSNEKPNALKWVKGFAIAQIVLSVAVIGLLVWIVEADPSGLFWSGFKEGFAGTPYAVWDYELIGYVAGALLIGVAASVVALVAIARRTKNWAYAAVIVIAAQVILGILGGSVPILHAIMLILMLTKPSKAYLGIPSK